MPIKSFLMTKTLLPGPGYMRARVKLVLENGNSDYWDVRVPFNDIHLNRHLEQTKANAVMVGVIDYKEKRGVYAVSAELHDYDLEYGNRLYIDQKRADTFSTIVKKRRVTYRKRIRISYLRGVPGKKPKRISYYRKVNRTKTVKFYYNYRNGKLEKASKGYSEKSRLSSTTGKRFNPEKDKETYKTYNENIKFRKNPGDDYNID